MVWKFLLIWFVTTKIKSLSYASDVSNQSDINYVYDLETNLTYAEDYKHNIDVNGSGDYTDDTTDDEDNYVEPDGTDDYFDEQAIKENNERAKNSVNASRLFYCDNSEVSLTIDKRCDGVRDCYDCSDETGCSASMEPFFYCYEKETFSNEATSNVTYALGNPYCIPRTKFCDGYQDCATALDEKQTGNGFKCAVKDRHRTCILPNDMVCDNVIDCEDESDSCDETETHVTSVSTFSKRKSARKDAFQCLNTNYNVSIFQHQVCDGVVDCPGLSDECLCVEAASESMRQLCSSVCWPRLYTDSRQPSNGCSDCEALQVRVCPDNYGENTTMKEEKPNSGVCTCVNIDDVCSGTRHGWSVLQQSVCITHKNKQMDLVECLSIDGSFDVVQARKCDERPECFFGEDECIPECQSIRPNRTVSNITGHFCDRFVHDYGYVCGNKTEEPLSDNIIPCDGVRDCGDGTDEMFCSTRIPCQNLSTRNGSTVTSTTSLSTDTFDINQLCDGIVHCVNKGDENPMICLNARKEDCLRSMPRSKTCDRNTSQGCTQLSSLPPGHSFVGSNDMSIGNRTATNSSLQYALLVFAATGIIGNFVGMLFALINSILTLRRQQEPSLKALILYLRESVLFSTVGLAKGLFCVYLAWILLYDASNEVTCWKGNLWRSDESCNVFGNLAFVSVNTTWFALFIYGTFETLSSFINPRQNSEESAAEFLPSNNGKKCVKNSCFVLSWIVASFVFAALIWLPMLAAAMWASSQYDTSALANITTTSNILQTEVINREQAMQLSERAVAMSGNPLPFTERFSWTRTMDLMANFSNLLGFQLDHVIGYYSYTTACLPLLLSTPSSAYHDRAAANFSFIFMILNCCICVYVLAVSTIGFFRVRKSLKSSENQVFTDQANDCSVLTFAVAEAVAWIPIFVMYFLSLLRPNTISDYLYQAILLLSLAVNCGVVSVVLHFRKQRVAMLICPSKNIQADDNRERVTMLNENERRQNAHA